MTALARPVALQAALFGALGVGAYALRRLARTPAHPLVDARPELARLPALALAASELARLAEAARLHAPLAALLDELVEIARLDAAGGLAAQWQIARRSTRAVGDAEALCRAVPIAESDELFRAALACREETVPQLRGALDDLLHNHLLSRAP